MNFKISQLPILNKEKKEFEYVKDVYKKKFKVKLIFFNQEEQPDTILVQDIVYVDRISI